MGIKADDFRIAAMCHKCHHELDAGNKLSKHERENMWEEAHRKTIGWLFINGYIEIKDK